MNKAKLWVLSLMLFSLPWTVNTIQAQSTYGEIRGKVTDAANGDPIQFAAVVVIKNGNQIAGMNTDASGNYTFKTIEPGDYVMKVRFVGYGAIEREVVVTPNNISIEDFKLNKGIIIKEVRVTTKKLIAPDDNTKSTGNDALTKLGSRSLSTIAGTAAGVNNTTSGVSFRGSRADGTATFVDGMRVTGALPNTVADRSQVSIIQSGVPAQFGDFTGGAISITTRGPSLDLIGSAEVISSSPFNPFHFNQFEGFLSGPLKTKREKTAQGDEFKRAVLGFMLAGTFTYYNDPSPSAIGNWILKDDVLRRIEENPLVPNVDGGFVHAGNFVTKNDMKNVKASPNSARWEGTLSGKLDYAPSRTTNITAYGFYNRRNISNYSFANSLMNYNQYSRTNDNTARAYLRFTQRLNNPDDSLKGKKTHLRDVWYNVRVDYQRTWGSTFDPNHGDDVFSYGYIGKFTKYPTPTFTYYGNLNNPDAPSRAFIDQNGDTVFLRNFWEQVGFRDTLITFAASDANPLRARYTQNLYSSVEGQGGTIFSEAQIQQLQGLLNGFGPPNVYSLWATPGFVTAAYNKNQTDRYTLYAMGEASLWGKKKVNDKKDIVPHDLQFGFMYEQTINRGYGLDATSLWRIMPLLMNSHISELDRSKPYLHYDANGVFQDTVSYERLINKSSQTHFDQKFREKLIANGATDVYGKKIGENSFVDINSFNPSDFELNMFNADELLNNGVGFVNYFGYDHLGNKTRGKPSVEDFTNDKFKRAIGAFQPNYTAAWLQDKFAYKDLIFRVGLRVERYDANQLTLKDPYSLYPIKTVGEVSQLNGNQVLHPSNMGDDYAVYVNDVNSPTKVLGYRNGNQWYDASGNELANPELIANQTSNGRIAPYLVDPANQQITSASFKDFTPKINVLPRVWFSFPINDKSLFYASYDVLAQRPLAGASFTTIDDYYFMTQRSNNIFANPDLKPRIKTEYQIGYKQQIGDNAALNLNAFYAEIRNDINLFQFNQAYPINYISYVNIDFSTIKGFSTEFEFSPEKHLNLSANYTLQFADGTGSNPNAARALVAANQPNLRTLFPLGDLDIRHSLKGIFNYEFSHFNKRTKKYEYSGPVIKGHQILKNSNLNLIFVANSGLPYTATAQAVQLGSATRPQIKGTPFGSRLPWQFTVNLNFSKGFLIERTTKDGDKKAPLMINAFLWVDNLFNALNIRGVYPFTGTPDDDGFLNSPEGQQAVQNQLSAQSYTDLYKLILNNPSNYAAPRFIRLGVRVNFNDRKG